jgi:hypothetical protein
MLAHELTATASLTPTTWVLLSQPSKTFDDVRGASVEINSYNSLKQYMPGEKELPRLTVL